MKLDNIKQNINEINLTDLSKSIVDSVHRGYFLSEAGKEHYKLLAYFSTKYNNKNIIDIGTYKGCSALALSYNKNNTITSFNVVDELELSDKPNNINFIVDDILNEKYNDLIMSSPFISLDTFHDGTFERKFHTFLQKINWKGRLLLDDIYLNTEMTLYWDSIKEE